MTDNAARPPQESLAWWVWLALLAVSLLCSVMLSSTISRREERWWHGRRQ